VKNLRKMDRLSAMTTASVRMAADDAGSGSMQPIGTGSASSWDRLRNTEHKVLTARVSHRRPSMVSPIHVPNTVMNAPAPRLDRDGVPRVNTTVNHQAVSGETRSPTGHGDPARRADVIFAGERYIVALFL